jgi:hypothetical protein
VTFFIEFPLLAAAIGGVFLVLYTISRRTTGLVAALITVTAVVSFLCWLARRERVSSLLVT